MDLFISILVLLTFPILFGVKHYLEYEAFSSNLWGNAEKIATILFLVYLTVIIIVGKEHAYTYYESVPDHKKFPSFFVSPSLGFGIAMFPRGAAEFSGSYARLAAVGMTRALSLIGWVLIAWLAMIFLV